MNSHTPTTWWVILRHKGKKQKKKNTQFLLIRERNLWNGGGVCACWFERDVRDYPDWGHVTWLSLFVERAVMWKPWNPHLHGKVSFQMLLSGRRTWYQQMRVKNSLVSLCVSCFFTVGQVLAEVHDGSHVAVDRGVRVGDGGLRLR